MDNYIQNPKRYDAHAHVFHVSDGSAEGARYVPNYDATLDEWLAILDANSLCGGTLVQPSFLGNDNSRLLKSISDARSRGYCVNGSAVVSPEIGLDELEQLASKNIVTLRLNLIERPLPEFTTGPWLSFFEKVSSTKLAIEVHLEAKRSLPVIKTIQKYNLKVVLDHYGLVESVTQLEQLLNNIDTKKLAIKRSAPYRLPLESLSDRQQLAAELNAFLLQRFPSSQVPSGSDWPHTRFEHHFSNDDVKNT